MPDVLVIGQPLDKLPHEVTQRVRLVGRYLSLCLLSSIRHRLPGAYSRKPDPMASVGTSPVMGIRDEVVALKRERTLSVAAELFDERGYGNTFLDGIAERMNVTEPFIYAHFAAKAELLAEICSRGIASALAALDGVLGTVPGPPAERLAALGYRFVTAVLESRRHIAIFSRKEKNLEPADFHRISEMRRSFDRRLVALLDEGQRSGDFSIADTRMAGLGIGGMVSWAYVWYRPDGRLTLEQTSEALTDLILGMVGAPRPAPSTKPRRVSRRRR
ncbi:MAG: TetR/AcrR family transcriptional regulator [Janthinobacterium lividum]